MKRIVCTIFVVVFSISLIITPVSAAYETLNENVILSESESQELKSENALNNKEEKKEYMREVFSRCGADPQFADSLSDYQLEVFVNADVIYGKKEEISVQNNEISTFANHGGNTKNYEKMELVIIWSRNGDIYSLFAGYSWLEIPWVTVKDIISVGMQDGSILEEKSCANLTYTDKDGITHFSEYNYRSEEYIGNGPYSVFRIDLPNDADRDNPNMIFTIGTDVRCTRDDITVTGQYFHNKVPLNFAVSIAWYIGISLSPNTYDEYPIHCGVDPKE